VDNIFLLKLILAFLTGGTWVLIATIIADKFGSKIGGLIAGLPSTLLFSLLFIGWAQTPAIAVKAASIVPIIGGINTLFLVIFSSKIKRGLLISLIYAFALWIILSFLAVILRFHNFNVILLGYVLMFSFSYYVFEFKLKIPSIAGKKIQYTRQQILLRGLLSGLIVSLSVLFGKIGGPTIGGMFGMFPAMFTSTLIITYLTHGPQFSSAIAKSSMISSISIVVYAVAVRHSYNSLGLVYGTVLATLVSFFSGYLIYKYVIKKVRYQKSFVIYGH